MGKKQQRIRAKKASAASAAPAPAAPAPAPAAPAAPAPAVPAPAAPAAAPGPSVVPAVVAVDIPWDGYKEAIKNAMDGNPHSDIIFGFQSKVPVEIRTIKPVAIEIANQNRIRNRSDTFPLADLVQFPTEQKVASKMRRRG